VFHYVVIGCSDILRDKLLVFKDGRRYACSDDIFMTKSASLGALITIGTASYSRSQI
jgi:hypothetical protein